MTSAQLKYGAAGEPPPPTVAELAFIAFALAVILWAVVS